MNDCASIRALLSNSVNYILDALDGPIADTLDRHGSEAEPAVTAFRARVRKRQPGARSALP
ncbi:MAG: hypothetical protein ACREKM_01550 [Longimicrobiales bacterium]